MKLATMKRITELWILCFLWIVYSIAGASGQFDANFTLQNVWGRLQADSRSIIQCLSDDNYKSIKFSRKLDTGQGARLPKLAQQYMQGKPVFARILFMPGEDRLNRFGAFQCKVMINSVATEIVTLKLPPSNLVELDALNPYKVASVNETVELEVNNTQKLEHPIKWRHNGVDVPEWNDQLRVEISNVQRKDSGIYECFYEGRRNEGVHALMRLIVRGCAADKYGKDCDQDCPPCYNGGVCHDTWGVCVCPAGFTGDNCEIACGGNRFGANCSKLCSPPQKNSNTDELCASHLFCKPDPYGCSCAPGFKGSSCMEHCEPGLYGADCKQPCHCAYGISSCNRITGACQGGCARGWRGNSCEIEDPNANNTMETTTMVYCPLGWYGPSCERECHCAESEHCHVVTGHCPSGCEEGWGGPSCGACRLQRFGDNCEFACHCEGGSHNCDKDGFCHNGCEAGWAGFTCQTECTPGRFGPNCASTCHCNENSTLICDKITGVCNGDCEAGFMGHECQTLCPQNKYGVNCIHDCFCMNGGHCNRIDGSCACDGRWKGQICNESEPQIVAATDEEVNAGQQVFISCTADAVPEPVMEISSSFSGSDDLQVHVRTLDQNQYQAVVKVKPKDAGQLDFLCKARNEHGFEMKKMTLTVIEAPRLISPPWLLSKTNLSLTVGWNEWVFSKDTGGSPTDKIEYMVMYRKSEASLWEKVDGWSTGLSNTVNDLTPNTQYEVAVKCRRLGKGGEGDISPGFMAKTECGVATVDGLAREVLPNRITESTVTLTWKRPYEGPLRCALEGYYLTYHPEPDETILQGIDMDADAYIVELEDLTPNTAYVIRLYAVTAVERSKYFVELTLRTGDTVPDPVTHLECRAVEEKPSLLIVSWEAPSEVNGAIKGYVVTYTLMDRGHCGQQFIDNEDTVKRKIEANDTEITLSNLHPYSTYNVSVQARTSAGESDPVAVYGATAEAKPSEPPSNVRVLSSTSRSLLYRWDQIPCEYANGIITHYEYMVLLPKDIYPVHLKLRKRSLDIPVPNSSVHVIEGLEVEIKNLEPDTEYGFMVRGATQAGAGDLSDVLNHRTEEDIPSAPQSLEVISRSPHEIGLYWSEPDVTNGRISKYQIQFWDHKKSSMVADVIYTVSDELDEILSTVVKGLTPATDFFIKIRASTSAGWGEFCSPISDRTLDGTPGEPAKIAVLHNGLTTLNLTWEEPSVKNGKLLGYKITYRPVLTLDPVFNTTPFTAKETEVNSSVKELELADLHPSTEYNISLMAKTSAGYGLEVSLPSWTVILGDHVSPSLRTLEVNVTNETIPIVFSTTGSTSVYKYQVIVEWSHHNKPINESLLSDYDTGVVKNKLPYYIAAELDPRNVSKEGEQNFVVGDNKMWGEYKNIHLNPGHEYKIRIRTLVYKDDEIKSVLSETEKISSAPTVVRVDKKFNQKIVGLDRLTLLLIFVALLVFITAVTFLTCVIVFVNRRRKKSTNSMSTHEFGRSESLTFSVMYRGPESEPIGGPVINDGYRTLPLNEKHASLRKKSDNKMAHGIRIESLQDFLVNALATNQIIDEFQRLVEGQTSPWTIARKSTNLKKNRYGNILPYDRHRVVLHTNSRNESDYINASYIDGYKRPREYIITQGPLDNTIEDFWRMVWQENAPAVVMVTDLNENGKKKCSKYWPDDSMMCGDLQILVIHSEECSDFIVRTILMRKLDEISTHRLRQYQFTAWPDRTVPLNTNYFIKFLKRVRDDHPILGGPMIVHCSAGAGRSGTYVAIDALCQQAAEEKRVDVFRFVNSSRHQRTHLVQTLEQYIFIYEALVEAYQFEDTCVPLDKIGIHLKELNHMSTLDQRALILKQYNKLNRTQKKLDTNRCSVALSECNVFRNRDPQIVPMDATRVRLQSDEQPQLSDYINAVFVDGYRKKNAYLATQMPLSHTIADFWRMIYLNKCSLIVMLNGSDETDDLDAGIYWPELGDSSYGDYDVQIITFEEQGDFVTRIMRLTNSENKNEEPHKVIQLQYKGWNYEMKAASVLKLLQTAELCYQRSSGGPVTVHCMDGATRTGLFIAARNVCDQIKAEDALDVYQIVKSIRTNRPEFIPNSDQYRFLFEIAQELLSE